MTITLNFFGRRAIILHRQDESISRLLRQLNLIGVEARIQWSPLETADSGADFVIVNADQGWNELFPWPIGEAPMPIIALLQSEAPGRVAWAIENGASAVLAKPVAASAVYPTLVMGVAVFEQRQHAASLLARLNELMKMRPLVHRAVQAIQDVQGTDEAIAYNSLREMAMNRRITIEQIAAEILAGAVSLTDAG